MYTKSKIVSMPTDIESSRCIFPSKNACVTIWKTKKPTNIIEPTSGSRRSLEL